MSYLHFRREFFDVTAKFLNGIKQENKKKIHLNILTLDRHEHLYDGKLQGISYTIIPFEYGFNYPEKVNFMVSQEAPYTVKLDEDVFIPTHVWDYFIENIPRLDNPKYVALSPILSNGVPTADWFIEQFFEQDRKNGIDDQQPLYDIILNTHMGVNCIDYSSLNEFTTGAKKWECEKFYEAVRKFPHYYKGIHPIRCSLEAQVKLLELLSQDKYVDKFITDTPKSVMFSDRPYFCNSVFAIKTDLYRKIWYDNTLRRDEFDEVPINLYREQNNLRWLFISRGFSIHTAYNWVPAGAAEQQFYEIFLRKLNERGF
jgi:hypothetical protein